MLRIMTGSLMLAVGMPVLADQPSYNYIIGGVQTLELDAGAGPDIDGDGFTLGGSFEVGDSWHVVGGYSTTGFDFDVDLNQLQIGGGYHSSTSDQTSFFADLLWVRAEIDAPGFGSVDETGYGFTVGVRSNISDRLELAGSLAYVDFGDDGDSTTLGGAAWYKVGETVALGVVANFEEDAVGYGIGARIYF